VLFALTGAGLLLTALALSNLFDDYKDSPDSMFIEAAVIPLAFSTRRLSSALAIGGAKVTSDL
jgi:hypothetical protein